MTKRWIWNDERYGRVFPYHSDKLTRSVSKLSYRMGKLDSALARLNGDEADEVERSSIADEIMESSLIEGEYLPLDEINRTVAVAIHGGGKAGGLVSAVMDAVENGDDMSVDRLHEWHRTLFRKESDDITPGTFRDYDTLRVLEGPVGAVATVYLAPPVAVMREQIGRLVNYINAENEAPCIKAAVAHLWFVSIHPYDDGNGRIARALVDYILSRDGYMRFKAFSLSRPIYRERDGYYDALRYATDLYRNRHFDFTNWIIWHNRMLLSAIDSAVEAVERMEEAR